MPEISAMCCGTGSATGLCGCKSRKAGVTRTQRDLRAHRASRIRSVSRCEVQPGCSARRSKRRREAAAHLAVMTRFSRVTRKSSHSETDSKLITLLTHPFTHHIADTPFHSQDNTQSMASILIVALTPCVKRPRRGFCGRADTFSPGLRIRPITIRTRRRLIIKRVGG